MKKIKTYFIGKKIFLIICFFLAFLFFLRFNSTQNSNKFDRLNSFFKVLRLIDDKYVDDPDMSVLTEGAISGMLNELDPHSVYINKIDYQQTEEDMKGEFDGIGVEFSIIDDYITVIAPIIDGPSYKAGIQSGDQIVKINGESAYQIKTPEVLKKLKGPKGTEVTVTIKRKGMEQFDRTLIRDRIPLKSVPTYFMIDKDVGYIKLSKFSRKTFNEFYEAFSKLEEEGMNKLLLDLRNNPGGLLDQAIDMLDMFISSNDTLLYTKGRIPDSNSVIRANYSRFDKNKVPIISIINRGSASASEIISGTLQDLDRGLVIGETSFGKGSVQQHYDLNDSSAVRITVAKFYTPSGRSIQRDYNSGDDDYYYNLNIDNRELSDSIKLSLPQFKTRKGRTVYGGGGITPDIYFKDSAKLSQKTVNLIYNPKRPLFNYSESIKERFLDNKDYSLFIMNSNETVNTVDFVNWLNANNYDYTDIDIDENWEHIKNRIIAELANKIFDRRFYYKTLIMNDKTVLEALNYFDEAKTLLN
jgi:carboxyl-terminal processing protease